LKGGVSVKYLKQRKNPKTRLFYLLTGKCKKAKGTRMTQNDLSGGRGEDYPEYLLG